MADNNTADWDDIHFGKEASAVIDPNVANLEEYEI